MSKGAPILTYIYDLDRRHCTYVSGSLLDDLGFTPELIDEVGARIFDILTHEQDRAGLAAHRETLRSAADDAVIPIEFRIRCPSGEWRRLVSFERPFTRVGDGPVTQILGIAEDVTDRRP